MIASLSLQYLTRTQHLCVVVPSSRPLASWPSWLALIAGISLCVSV